ncbi:shikimate 5-dehydrogenase I alpha [Candidatus Symbiothrix dinenymphae]|nr:shikimate 5-dehydrogenase I alpha [Candidatus Symbiothrix dinenymphae]
MKDLYGLIGFPLKHSFSRNYFNDKFAAEKIDAEYINFEIPAIQDFKSVIKNNPNLKGLNVTIPYKEQVIPFLDGLDSHAKAIGAVNVIKFDRSQKGKLKLIGHNSDVIGFKESIATEIKYGNHQQALILGTGGAAKAVFHGLKQLGVTSTFVSRKKAPCLCELDPHFPLTYSELTPEVMALHTVIVNCTPVGMWPDVDECPDIPYNLLTDTHLLYDLLYNPNETQFMKHGQKCGATVKNGLEMLLLQAFAGWEIWQK